MSKRIQHRTTRKDKGGFIPKAQTYPKNSDRPWTKFETDEMLDRYFDGKLGSLLRYAREVGRSVTCVARHIKVFTHKDKDTQIWKYHPTDSRRGRAGERFSPVEIKFIEHHLEYEVPVEFIARVLDRPEKEVEDWIENCEHPDDEPVVKEEKPADFEKMLVDLCTDLEQSGYDRDDMEFESWLEASDHDELQKWWHKHKATTEAGREKLRKEALALLTNEQKKVLGLTDDVDDEEEGD